MQSPYLKGQWVTRKVLAQFQCNAPEDMLLGVAGDCISGAVRKGFLEEDIMAQLALMNTKPGNIDCGMHGKIECILFIRRMERHSK